MEPRLIKYLSDHELHTDLGNELGEMHKDIEELKSASEKIYKKKKAANDPKLKEWLAATKLKIEKQQSRLDKFMELYNQIDTTQSESLSLRRRFRAMQKYAWESLVVDGSVTKELSKEQHQTLVKLLRDISIVESENREIEQQTKHVI